MLDGVPTASLSARYLSGYCVPDLTAIWSPAIDHQLTTHSSAVPIAPPRLSSLIDELPRQQSAAERYADTVVATWGAIETALQPVFGSAGSLALCRRSLQLTEGIYPWLTPLAVARSPIDASLLRQTLSSRSQAEAVAASNAWFRNFQQVLSALIGPSLSSRILKPIWTHPGALAVPTGRRDVR